VTGRPFPTSPSRSFRVSRSGLFGRLWRRRAERRAVRAGFRTTCDGRRSEISYAPVFLTLSQETDRTQDRSVSSATTSSAQATCAMPRDGSTRPAENQPTLGPEDESRSRRHG
jgi:hypothetical protein